MTMRIAVATSIPPKTVRMDAGALNEDYQKACIQSWIACGFRVMSVNAREELPDLAARFPEVQFIATDRSASAWTGRNNPYVADLLSALLSAPEPALGIINSDLLFEPSGAWSETMPPLVTEAMLVANRYDAASLLEGPVRRFHGIDCFFFNRGIAVSALQDALPFAMGVPWWDYWLSCVGLLNGRRIAAIDRPAVLHLSHEQGYIGKSRHQFAEIFALSILQRCETAPKPLPEIVSAIIPICQEILQYPLDAPSADFQSLTSQLGPVLMPKFRTKALKLIPEPANSKSPVFAHFEDRLAAGKALAAAEREAGRNKKA
jgi:hypothetical protein